MRFSNQSRYALRATLVLAKLSKDGNLVSINNLFEQEQISALFLEQFFLNYERLDSFHQSEDQEADFALPVFWIK